MADNTLDVIFRLRYDTYSNWMNSDVILMSGEAAIAAFPSPNPNLPPTSVGIKIGDGRHYFDELPWIQALAADVYAWAKAAQPPAASTIPGLAEYIAAHSGSSGGGSSGSGSYQIIYDSNSSKYILQQWDEENQEWVNTSSEIDFSDVLTRINNIERWANGEKNNLGNIYDPISSIVYDEVVNYINRLDVSDSAVAHEFVTQVQQVDGKIRVTRSIISAADITAGTLPTARGGTGLSAVYEDELLVGSSNGTITARTFVTEIDGTNRNSFATVGAIIDYIAVMTAGLTGAMHFVGEATITIAVGDNSRADPQINGYNFREAQPGDVILANGAQEFVWTGSNWRLLGDEGSYAIKGSITNTDIAEEANIDQSKINGLEDTFDTKVDKVEGKALSSNDYTDDDKLKLSNIEDEAQVNVIEHIFLNDEEISPSTVSGLEKSIDLHFNGMSIEQGEKLDGIEAGAQVNVIEHIKLNGTEVAPDNTKTVNLQLVEYTNEEKEKLATIAEGAQVNTIDKIIFDGEEQTPNEEGTVSISSNPHTEHINKIEQIYINGTEYPPDANKVVHITLDQAALNLNVLEGARYPNDNNSYTDIDVTNKKLELSHIAASGDVAHLLQTQNTYIILNCGNSTTVI